MDEHFPRKRRNRSNPLTLHRTCLCPPSGLHRDSVASCEYRPRPRLPRPKARPRGRLLPKEHSTDEGHTAEPFRFLPMVIPASDCLPLTAGRQPRLPASGARVRGRRFGNYNTLVKFTHRIPVTVTAISGTFYSTYCQPKRNLSWRLKDSLTGNSSANIHPPCPPVSQCLSQSDISSTSADSATAMAREESFISPGQAKKPSSPLRIYNPCP